MVEKEGYSCVTDKGFILLKENNLRKGVFQETTMSVKRYSISQPSSTISAVYLPIIQNEVTIIFDRPI